MRTVEQATDQEPQTSLPQEEDRVDALDILLVLAYKRRLVGIATLGVLAIGIALALLLRPNFTSTALILPPQQQSSSASALLGQLGILAGVTGGEEASSALGLKSPGDLYVGILASETIEDGIISKFNLKSHYKTRTMVEARKALESHTDLTSEKDGLISIAVTDHDSHLASDIANAYISELYDMNSHLAITEAAQRRIFFENEVAQEKKQLNAAEDNLAAMQRKTGVIQLTGQTAILIETIAQLRAKIQASQVDLQAMQTFATSENPDIQRLKEQISTMQAQLVKLENGQQQTNPGNITVPAGRIPEDIVEYSRKYRDVQYHEELYELLSRQYEAARIDEAKAAPVIQVVDYATPSDKRSGPKRSLILLGSVFLGFTGSCFWVLLMHGLTVMRNSARMANKIIRLKSILNTAGKK